MSSPWQTVSNPRRKGLLAQNTPVQPYQKYPGRKSYAGVTKKSGNNQIMPTDAQKDNCISALNAVQELPNIKPKIFKLEDYDVNGVDYRVATSYPAGLYDEDRYTFCRMVSRAIGQSLTADEHELIRGTSWLPGQASIGGAQAVFRVILENPDEGNDTSKEQHASLVTKLCKGVTVTIEDNEFKIDAPPAPPSTLIDTTIIRISNLHRRYMRMGIGKQLFTDFIQKLTGFEQAELVDEFVLVNPDWNVDHQTRDLRSIYISLVGVDSSLLVDNYMQVRMSAADIMHVSQMPASYPEVLGRLAVDQKNKRQEALPKIILRKDDQDNQNSADALVRIGNLQFLPDAHVPPTQKVTIELGDDSDDTIDQIMQDANSKEKPTVEGILQPSDSSY